ncbi:uncharacterized protein BXZ73DRAFT_37522 [Epithele typhae]|uniref:uncharacterized protein n=1 Tax=Epithele typhae TaxID=378194 RepID=UPI002007A742|nr:uncharacterized protein BXZ73DRAFT_37522 [Epithele typhae]KAH9946389.1 hypothetical protein BXZ73DRAFT_37522 [Epithele typhae]
MAHDGPEKAPEPSPAPWRACLHRLSVFPASSLARRPLARLLSTFLCALIIVIRPFARLGGRYAFLVLALKELVFSVQENLAQQLELTCLNIIGALLGIGLSTLAKYLASLAGPDSQTARITCFVFLILISFLAGVAKSRLVRLQLSTRISCFISIWLLTGNIGVSDRVLADSGNFLWVTLSAAIIGVVSLLVMMVIFRGSTTNFELETAATFAVLQECLSTSLYRVGARETKMDVSYYRQLHAQLLQRSIKLNESYSQAAFELRVGRLSLQSIRPFVGIVEHLRRELVWGLSPVKPLRSIPGTPRSPGPGTPRSLPQSPRSVAQSLNEYFSASQHPLAFVSVLEPPALDLAQAVLDSMKTVEHMITVIFHQRSAGETPESAQSISGSQKVAVHAARSKLEVACNKMREVLKHVFDQVDMHQRAEGKQPHLPKEIFDCSLAAIALLQMAQEMAAALHLAEHVARRYEESPTKLWYPRISLQWLGVPPGQFISDDHNDAAYAGADASGENSPADAETDERLTVMEARQGIVERAFEFTLAKHGRHLPAGGIAAARYRVYAAASASRMELKALKARVWTWRFWRGQMSRLWSSEQVLRARVWLSKRHRAVQHSSHWKHGLKNAIGVAVLTFPAFLPADSPGRLWFQDWRGQWMTISYLWVLETNTGATWRTGYLRLVGTLLGATYAYVTALICGTNPYGLVTMVTAFDIPITWIILRTSVTPLAVPASVTLPPIVFAHYTTPDTTASVLHLTVARAAMIAAGILAAVIVNSMLFPRHCRVLFLNDTARTLGRLSTLYLTLSHDMFRMNRTRSLEERRKQLKLELQTRSSLYRLSALLKTMNDELSLLPKPLGQYRNIVTTMQKLLDLMTGLRKIRENIPRKETVSSVFKERREFMSCVCIILYACQHAFRAREPLPQFLPSARHAFAQLEAHVQECIAHAREEQTELGLSLVYAFAEQEVMQCLVDTLEELLERTGQLFGTSAWLTHESHFSRSSTIEEGVDHGWFSTFRTECRPEYESTV